MNRNRTLLNIKYNQQPSHPAFQKKEPKTSTSIKFWADVDIPLDAQFIQSSELPASPPGELSPYPNSVKVGGYVPPHVRPKKKKKHKFTKRPAIDSKPNVPTANNTGSSNETSTSCGGNTPATVHIGESAAEGERPSTPEDIHKQYEMKTDHTQPQPHIDNQKVNTIQPHKESSSAASGKDPVVLYTIPQSSATFSGDLLCVIDGLHVLLVYENVLYHYYTIYLYTAKKYNIQQYVR
ncbi:uncharacterized protein LOC131855660 [Achroia grisella]|uniref:uncharacterized protein LOC131855660 n=1 Tax=Achroia grisella TaxID=688607 RepID=UPI0027D207B5|nr:uncharacterized protein LOC131855660 [Achroia grisella]